MTLTKERVEELEAAMAELKAAKEAGRASQFAHRDCRRIEQAEDAMASLLAQSGPALLAAYRTREAAIAECEAWRELYEADMAEDEDRGDIAWNQVEEARAATDASRRGEGQ